MTRMYRMVGRRTTVRVGCLGAVVLAVGWFVMMALTVLAVAVSSVVLVGLVLVEYARQHARGVPARQALAVALRRTAAVVTRHRAGFVALGLAGGIVLGAGLAAAGHTARTSTAAAACAPAAEAYQNWAAAMSGGTFATQLPATDELRQAVAAYPALEQTAEALYADLTAESIHGSSTPAAARVPADAAAVRAAAAAVSCTG